MSTVSGKYIYSWKHPVKNTARVMPFAMDFSFLSILIQLNVHDTQWQFCMKFSYLLFLYCYIGCLNMVKGPQFDVNI